MGVIAPFVYASWREVYPEFSNVSGAQVDSVVLPIAQTYCRNDGGGPISDVATQSAALGLMVAHVCQLMFGSTMQPITGATGRVASATQGSVTVSLDYNDKRSAASWYIQTRYGAAYWQLIQPYTLAVYKSRRLPQPRPYIYN